MKSHELNKPLLQQHEHNDNESKCNEILTSTMSIFTRSNISFIIVMLLSLIPLYACTLFYEFKLQQTLYSLANLSAQVSFGNGSYTNYLEFLFHGKEERLGLFRVVIYYLFSHPVLEFFSMITTMNLGAIICSGEARDYNITTIKDILCRNTITSLKAPFITFLYVHLFTVFAFISLLLLGLTYVWFAAHNYLLYQGICITFFGAMLYKYVDWTVSWQLAMVISALDIESGVSALRLSSYYRKRLGQTTGFRLMLNLTLCAALVRVPSVYAGKVYGSAVGVLVMTPFLVGLLCLTNWLKWLVFLNYYYDCQQQIVEKYRVASDSRAADERLKYVV